jgi:hypothetical protein
MNIFYLDNDTKKCAEMHVDKHCVKMILEYAQLLSTAHRVLDGRESVTLSSSGRKKKVWLLSDSRNDVLYSATHINHPSAIWVRHSYENYEWLYNMFVDLLKEYTYRYHKFHACERLLNDLYTPPNNIPKGVGFTEPTPAMPDHYKVPGDSIQSYKNYYLGDKTRMFSWKNRKEPVWITK